jgi:hypothetical protein
MAKATNESKNALVVLSDAALTVPKAQLKKFQARTVDAIELIGRTERDNVLRRVLVGFALLIVKESAPHKEFMPWLKENVTGAGYTQCTYFMRAARACIDELGIARPELLTLAGNVSTLQLGKKAAGTKLVAEVKKFVGEQSWTELLEAHGIKDTKKIGGARTQTPAEADAAADAEQLYLFSRDEIGGCITQAESLLLKENRLQHLVGHPEEIRGVVESLRSLADRVEAAAKPLLKKANA